MQNDLKNSLSEYKKQIERIIESYPEDKTVLIDFKILEKFDPPS